MSRRERDLIINDDIRANKILLLDEDGEKIWVFSKFDALQKWQLESKDIIQIWYNQNDAMVIAKYMEVWKYLYLQKKKEHQDKKNVLKSSITKEIKFGYRIWDNDLEMKITKAREFLQEWFSVKFNAVLKWRENAYKNIMLERLNNILKNLEEFGKNQWVKQERNWFIVILFPKA